jgi:hypothetical protein
MDLSDLAFAVSRRLASADCGELPTFAILRRQLLAGRKVQPPFWLEGLADPDGSAVKERVSDAFKRP